MTARTSPKIEDRVIPQGSGLCPWIELNGRLPVAVEFPDSWTAAPLVCRARLRSTGSGGLVFDDNPDSGGAQITIAAAADRFTRLDERLFLGAVSIAFSADGQAAPRVISVALLEADVVLGFSR